MDKADRVQAAAAALRDHPDLAGLRDHQVRQVRAALLDLQAAVAEALLAVAALLPPEEEG